MHKTAVMLLSLVVLSTAAMLLSACNTTEGAGRDISAAGQGVSNAAQDTKDKM